METTDRLARAREMRARPVCRLQCPTGEHGPGILLYIRPVKGWCWCGKVLRFLAPEQPVIVRPDDQAV